MKKFTKILLALATLWPFLYVILFFVFAFSTVLFMPTSSARKLIARCCWTPTSAYSQPLISL